jgi:hypothetical protein
MDASEDAGQGRAAWAGDTDAVRQTLLVGESSFCTQAVRLGAAPRDRRVGPAPQPQADLDPAQLRSQLGSVRAIDRATHKLGQRKASPNCLAGEERMLAVRQRDLCSPAHVM